MSANAVVEDALELAGAGYPVLPLHFPDGGGCSCGRSNCTSPGKHPRTRHGFKDATSDIAQVRRWWDEAPKANLGLATGGNLVVVDIDGQVGEESVLNLGTLPETASAQTGRGRHLYFSGTSQSHVGLLPGIDIRGEGGLVVAPPSFHASGVQYEWVSHLLDGCADLPAGVLEVPSKQDGLGPNLESMPGALPEVIPVGQRNAWLFKLGCRIRNCGFGEEEILATLSTSNDVRCQEPLPGVELAQIAANVAKLPPQAQVDRALSALQLGPHARAVYQVLRDHFDWRGECFPGLERIAQHAGMSKPTVHKYTKVLEEADLISVDRGPWRSNRYKLLDPFEGSASQPSSRENSSPHRLLSYQRMTINQV